MHWLVLFVSQHHEVLTWLATASTLVGGTIGAADMMSCPPKAVYYYEEEKEG